MIRDMNVMATLISKVTAKVPAYEAEEVDERFLCKLDPPTNHPLSFDDTSPRSQTPYLAYFRAGLIGRSDQILAGSRLTMTRVWRVGDDLLWESGKTFEAVLDARAVRVGGRNVSGWELKLMPYDELYPFTDVDIIGPDGEVLGTTNLSKWTSEETEEDHGTYEDFDGEAPIEAAPWFETQNAKFVIDGRTYRVRTAVVDLQKPRVRFRARRANG